MHLKLKLALSLLITVVAAYLLRPVIFKVTLPFVLSGHGLGYWFGNLIYPYYPDHDPGLILVWDRDCDLVHHTHCLSALGVVLDIEVTDSEVNKKA
jgi:hypothetical protein